MKPPEPFEGRPATPADAEDVAALMVAFDKAYLDEPDSVSVAEVADWWAGKDLARDTLLVSEPRRGLAAIGMLREQGDVLEVDAVVHPGSVGCGLGSFLLDWAEAEYRRRERSLLRTSALAADPVAARLIAGRGFEPIRHFYRMLIDLDGPPPEPVWPDGFEVSVFAGEEEALHAVLEESFAEHWGHQPQDLSEWEQTVFGREWWDPSLVYLVRKGSEVVAAEINSYRFGVGWIGTLGTRRPWRGLGLGRALLLTAFAEFFRRGQLRIGLAVDAGNETGATHLYENVGMRVAWQADVYEKRR